MIATGLVAFNLLVNAVLAFVVALSFVRAAERLFRPTPGPVHVALLAIPYVKLAIDIVRGVPANSFLWLRSLGVPQDLGSFQLGVGLWWIVPRLQLCLGALSHGWTYTQSAADLLAALLMKRVSVWAPSAVAVLLLAPGLVLLARRALGWYRADRARRSLLEQSQEVLVIRIGRRTVPVLVASTSEGAPFMGGVFSPYVVMPRTSWDRFTVEERTAAIEHEAAHVAERHLLVMTLVGVCSDVFWFIPFVRHAERKLREACELAADARAIHRGIRREVLASALVRAGEAMIPPASGEWASVTLGANRTALRMRLEHLLEDVVPARFGFQHPLLRVVLTAWVASAVILTVAFGNH